MFVFLLLVILLFPGSARAFSFFPFLKCLFISTRFVFDVYARASGIDLAE